MNLRTFLIFVSEYSPVKFLWDFDLFWYTAYNINVSMMTETCLKHLALMDDISPRMKFLSIWESIFSSQGGYYSDTRIFGCILW